jgi:RNA polymerase sigma factor (sigma-70 family)
MSQEAIALWTETSSDPELIAGVRAGDATAFGVLYERHVDAARKVASQYTNTAADVDDVVAESFSRVLRALQQGDGPDLAFRAYLFTIVRRTGMDIINRGNRTRPGDDMAQYESAMGYEAPSDEGALEGFEQGIVADAFRSLPERWQAVLWYTEVEKKSPKEIAPLLGLTANGVAALAYRAREALRQAYLQQHLNTADSMDCLAASTQLGAYVRGGLAKRDHAKVEEHVDSCEKCAALVAELEDVNRGMRGIIAPLVLGVLGVGALEGGLPVGGALGAKAAAGAGTAGSAVAGGSGSASLATGSGLSAWIASTAAIVLPAAAALGVVALVVSGASFLGVFNPLGRSEGQTPSTQTTPDPSETGATDPSAAPSTAPSAEPSATPSPEPSVEPSADAGEGDTGGAPAGVVGNETGGGTGGDTGGQTGGNSGGSTGGGDTGGGDTGGGDTGGGDTGGGDTGGGDTDTPTPPKAAAFEIGQAPLNYLEIPVANPAVSMLLTNAGDGDATDVTASIELPDGLTFATPSGGTAGGAPLAAEHLGAFLRFAQTSSFTAGSWECTLDGTHSTATCELAELAAGTSTTLALNLTSVDDIELGDDAWTTFSASAEGVAPQSYKVLTAVAANDEDLKGDYAKTGHLDVTQVGGTVMGCDPKKSACAGIMKYAGTGVGKDVPSSLNNNDNTMVALNPAGGDANSGTTKLVIPAGAKVKYALLEWSANSHQRDSWTRGIGTARLKALDGSFVTVTADKTATHTVNGTYYYQARANVTAAVAAAGSGEYSVADIALAAGGDKTNLYGGFSLTVVYELQSLPVSSVAVFTGSQWVTGNQFADFAFNAASASSARVGWTAWDADRGFTGDRMSLDSKDLTPNGWDGSAVVPHSSQNAADATAFGSPFANTLGIDAKDFAVVTGITPGKHTLKAWTNNDTYLIGSLTVTLTSAG